MSRIELSGLTKDYGSTRALNSIDLDVADGEFIVFLGPSGCGKSTLLRMIAGLAEPTAGEIRIDGHDVTDLPPRDRRLAMVFQSYALYPHLTVAKNVAFPLRARSVRRAEITGRVERVASSLALTELLARRPAALSGGQRQRVALARAMVQEPGAYLMDEPLSNLDARLRSATRTELVDLHDRIGATFLYVTHDQIEAMSMATRIVLLDSGHVEQVGAPDELYDQPASTFVAAFLGAPPMCLFDAVVASENDRMVVRAPGIHLPIDLPTPAGGYAPHEVTAGIRPERMVLDPRGQIAAEVLTVENVGSDEVLHLRAHTTTLQARVRRPTARAGDHIRLSVAAGDIHLFDRSSGRRLQWKPDTSTTRENTLIRQGAAS
ncbi:MULTISPECIES: ABC transporter ATP-binding protein [Gordonia]|uniref:Trehalose import ATP-binding protein SugC n=1 Tax=Gordonia amicalis TaxID=89053 RepID=A0AAE4U6B0_9ACTN|nr:MULTISPECIES: ABC transporter ATP-binding protein [Gordonia]ATD69767.1 ABC transporter ATP-binding protein [Gordonia sp. 1D]KAF0968549.1 sn-glycerol-3-phosphate import ATP-binding protein UgpC [Gordonia sp. YY1]MBA5846826.1 ABC transporter ATP-binding protein [Gordonia amicalis]MCZ0911822.1 ABC transporter ATP-binding protein [Gordonia amicalis]MCZ4579336.1 ABC transporter ATP-binding protein [Gordonia amicalis]